MNPEISFVIPHKGREELLLLTLESIFKQNFQLDKIEIIVVTQNNVITPSITQLIHKFPLQIFYRPSIDTVSYLRNFGADKARGKYIAFIDSDIELSKNWVKTMLNLLNEDPKRVLVGAGQINSKKANALEQIRSALSYTNIDTIVNVLPGGNLFTKKEVFEKAGKFPTQLTTCEDYYFTGKVNTLGNIYFTSKAGFIHLGEDKTYIEMFNKEIWRGQSNLQSIKGRRIPLEEIPSFVIPPAILLFFISSLILFVLGHPLIALSSLFFSLVPIALYSVRLYLKSHKKIGIIPIGKFYFLYFPARAIGTLIGIFKNITTNDHR